MAGCLSVLVLTLFFAFFILELDLYILRYSFLFLLGSCNYVDPDLFPDQAILFQMHALTCIFLSNPESLILLSAAPYLWLWEEVSE